MIAVIAQQLVPMQTGSSIGGIAGSRDFRPTGALGRRASALDFTGGDAQGGQTRVGEWTLLGRWRQSPPGMRALPSLEFSYSDPPVLFCLGLLFPRIPQ